MKLIYSFLQTFINGSDTFTEFIVVSSCVRSGVSIGKPHVFNDKYAEVDKEDLLKGFDDDLSVIGEALEARFALEDELIDNLFSNHAN